MRHRRQHGGALKTLCSVRETKHELSGSPRMGTSVEAASRLVFEGGAGWEQGVRGERPPLGASCAAGGDASQLFTETAAQLCGYITNLRCILYTGELKGNVNYISTKQLHYEKGNVKSNIIK